MDVTNVKTNKTETMKFKFVGLKTTLCIEKFQVCMMNFSQDNEKK